ncbi:hypothetical protein CCP1ISM_3700002 [Azospirillaceae bacterium]
MVLVPADGVESWHRWTRQGEVMLAAQWVRLPTVNGLSGNAPPGWQLFDPADGPGYRRALIDWADRYQLWPLLCGLDLDHGQWQPVDRARLAAEAAGS